MKLKYLLLLVINLLVLNVALAQRQTTTFLKNRNTQVSTRDSADFIRVITEPEAGSALYDVKEYYKNNQIKLTGKSLKNDNQNFDGEVIAYFPSGKKQYVATYKAGNLVGDFYDYYPNGKPYNIYTVANHPADVEDRMTPGISFKTCYDSLGHALINKGTGHYINYDKDFKTVLDEGGLINSHKNGLWKGFDKKDGIVFTEEYDMGKMVKGSSLDKQGKKYTYTQREVIAEFKGGGDAFSAFLQQNIQYPKYSKEHNVEGRVFILYDIEINGTLTNVQVARAPNNQLGAEALRVIKMLPPMVPGKRYGQIVKTTLTVPINFSLQ